MDSAIVIVVLEFPGAFYSAIFKKSSQVLTLKDYIILYCIILYYFISKMRLVALSQGSGRFCEETDGFI